MAFQGSLKELLLPDIVQLVSVSGKTGKFVLTRDDREGHIFLKDGQIIHAEVGDVSGEEAVYALAIWDDGEFVFTPGNNPTEQTITKSNTNLLMEAARRLDEWRVLSKKIPSVEMVPMLKADPERRDQISLSPLEWTIVTQIDSVRSIAEIGKGMNWAPFEVAKLLYGMVSSNLVELKKKVHLSPPPTERPTIGVV